MVIRVHGRHQHLQLRWARVVTQLAQAHAKAYNGAQLNELQASCKRSATSTTPHLFCHSSKQIARRFCMPQRFTERPLKAAANVCICHADVRPALHHAGAGANMVGMLLRGVHGHHAIPCHKAVAAAATCQACLIQRAANSCRRPAASEAAGAHARSNTSLLHIPLLRSASDGAICNIGSHTARHLPEVERGPRQLVLGTPG